MLAHCRQLSAEKCCACAGDDLVADMAATGGGTGRRAWLGRLPGVRVTGSHAQLMLPGRFLLHRPLPLSRSAIHPCWGARACHVLLKLAACCHQVLHCVLHDLTVTWSGMHGLSMAAGHGDISTLDLSCLPAAGAHNTANAATAALLAASLGVGVSPASLQRTIPLLKAPPHRCALVLFSCHVCPSWLTQQPGSLWRAVPGSGSAGQSTIAAQAHFALAAQASRRCVPLPQMTRS